MGERVICFLIAATCAAVALTAVYYEQAALAALFGLLCGIYDERFDMLREERNG